MTIRRVAGLAALAIALTGSALAGQAEPLVLAGDYLFNTNDNQGGHPVCTELWSFGPDGAMTVESGAERVRKRYRTETDRDGRWLVTETLETNGAPDCLGHRSEGVTPGESRTYLVPLNDRTIQTCPPPQRMPDGAPFVSDCYGWIVLAADAG